MKQDSLCFAERNLVLRLSPTDGICSYVIICCQWLILTSCQLHVDGSIKKTHHLPIAET